MLPDLTVVIPTLNERGNVRELARRINAVLPDQNYRLMFVDDDSGDGTRTELAAMAAEDPRVSFIHRVGRSGLGSAVIEGAMASQSRYVAVMDADLQHDERLLPEMLRMLEAEPHDIVIGSRFVEGADLGEFAASRVKLSETGIKLARNVLGMDVKDPLTGYFMMRRTFFDRIAPNLEGRGFKILLDILHKGGGQTRFKEIPFTFGTRLSGESKLDASVSFDYLAQLYEAKFGAALPLRVVLGYFSAAAYFLGQFALAVSFGAFGVGSFGRQFLAAVTMIAVGFFARRNFLKRRRRPKGALLAWSLSSNLAIALPVVVVAGLLARALPDEGAASTALAALAATAGLLLGHYAHAFPLPVRQPIVEVETSPEPSPERAAA